MCRSKNDLAIFLPVYFPRQRIPFVSHKGSLSKTINKFHGGCYNNFIKIKLRLLT